MYREAAISSSWESRMLNPSITLLMPSDQGRLCGPFRWIDIRRTRALCESYDRPLPTLSASPEVPASFRERREGGTWHHQRERLLHLPRRDAERWQKLRHEHASAIRRLQGHTHPLENDDKAT